MEATPRTVARRRVQEGRGGQGHVGSDGGGLDAGSRRKGHLRGELIAHATLPAGSLGEAAPGRPAPCLSSVCGRTAFPEGWLSPHQPHSLLARAAWQLQASCAFSWQGPWAQAWLPRPLRPSVPFCQGWPPPRLQLPTTLHPQHPSRQPGEPCGWQAEGFRGRSLSATRNVNGCEDLRGTVMGSPGIPTEIK